MSKEIKINLNSDFGQAVMAAIEHKASPDSIRAFTDNAALSQNLAQVGVQMNDTKWHWERRTRMTVEQWQDVLDGQRTLTEYGTQKILEPLSKQLSLETLAPANS